MSVETHPRVIAPARLDRAASWAVANAAPLLAFAVALLIAWLLRIGHPSREGLWLDEIYSVWLARQPLAAIIPLLRADVHPPLYYLLLHGWFRVAGSSDEMARL